MSEDSKNIVIFTGQPGQKIMECLDRLKTQLTKKVSVFSIEKNIGELEGKDLRDILSYTQPAVEQLWSRSFDEVYSQIKESKELTFLTFHSVYYHQGTSGFICCSDLRKLAKLNGRVKSVVTFIDDIYDIYQNLMEPGEMFSYVLDERRFRAKHEAIFASIDNLQVLLNWREAEIMHSRAIARFLSAPFYIIPIKYPAFMVSRLFERSKEELKIFYLSHPIRLAREKGETSLVGEVNEFTRSIIKYPDIFLFYPTGIDELRIKREEQLYQPSLLPRWNPPFREDEWIKPPTTSTAAINPLNPLNESNLKKAFKLMISSSLERLSRRIENQIASRDYSFLEESKNGVFVYRPDFASVDISKEVEYNIKLWVWELEKIKKGSSERRNYVLISNEDLMRWRIKELYDFLTEKFEFSNNQAKDVKKCIENLKSKLIQVDITQEDITEIKRKIHPLLKDLKIKEIAERRGILDEGIMSKEREKREKILDDAIRKIASPPLLRLLADTREISMYKSKEDIPSSRFLQEIFNKKEILKKGGVE